LLLDFNRHFNPDLNWLFSLNDIRYSFLDFLDLGFGDDVWNFDLHLLDSFDYLIADHCLLYYLLYFQYLLDFDLYYFLGLSDLDVFDHSVDWDLLDYLLDFVDRHCLFSHHWHFDRSLADSVNNHIAIDDDFNCLFGCYLHWNVICDNVLHRFLDDDWHFFVDWDNLQLFFAQNDMAGFIDRHSLFKGFGLIDDVLDDNGHFDIATWGSKKFDYLFGLNAIKCKFFQQPQNPILELEIQIIVDFQLRQLIKQVFDQHPQMQYKFLLLGVLIDVDIVNSDNVDLMHNDLLESLD